MGTSSSKKPNFICFLSGQQNNCIASFYEKDKELNISIEEESLIKLEKDLIKTMIKIREEKGVTQADLA